MATIAIANPTWSIRRIEKHLNLKPSNDAAAFKKGTAAREAAQAEYDLALISYNS